MITLKEYIQWLTFRTGNYYYHFLAAVVWAGLVTLSIITYKLLRLYGIC